MGHGIKATPVVHKLGENTQAFKTNDVNEIYFTVSKNNWSDRARGTFMIYAGAYEHSNMLKDHIEQLTDAGFDVVTLDMPGTGQSFRHAEVGTTDLNHMASYEERVQAAKHVMQYYQDNFANGQEAQFHALTSGNGSVDFLKTLVETEAGTTKSVTMVNPHFDVDVNAYGADTYESDGNIFTKSRFDAEPASELDGKDRLGTQIGKNEIVEFVGPHVAQHFKDANGAQKLPASTNSYFNTYAKGVEEVQDKPKSYVDALKNNNVRITAIYDGQNDSNPIRSRFNDEEYTLEWFEENGLDAHPSNFEGAGAGLLYSAEHIDAVLNNAILNAEHSSPRARIIGQIKNIDEYEWESSLTRAELKELQKTLEDKGFSVGPPGIDGEVRFASVSFTENALADFIMEAEKQGKVNLSDIKQADVTPENLLNFVKTVNLAPPKVPQVANAPSLQAVISY